MTQLVGQVDSSAGGSFSVGVELRPGSCDGAPLWATQRDDGSVFYTPLEAETGPWGGPLPTIEVQVPWAIDAAGTNVRTWYSVENGLLIQNVDPTQAFGIVT